jgi:plasmid stabilization system protein ParE
MAELALEWSALAEEDLDRVALYTAERQGDAEGYVGLLFAAAEQLQGFPFLGHPLTGIPPYRRLVVGEHLLLYMVQEGAVRVVRVGHAAQDVEDLLP